MQQRRPDWHETPERVMDRAYVDALKMLARRELSEAQVRQRLERLAHDPAAIDSAVTRLRAERAVDDERVAGAIARWQSTVKRRGRARVIREIERTGITAATARRATDQAFESVDGPAQIEASLARRLGGRERAGTPAEFARLYRYLIGQGWDADEVTRALRSKVPRQDKPE
jgi:regulatory protein